MLIHNADITGSLLVNGIPFNTGSFSGSFTGTIEGVSSTASYVEYTNVANKPTLVSGSSQVTYSGLTGVPVGIVSGSSQVADFGIFATTGSNGFNGSQAITGSLTVTGAIVAQTLNVQQVTSSVVFSSGSNVFGNDLGNTQQFTGSVSITGSLNTSITAFGSAATTFLTSDGGTIRSRTAAQTLSDIAALPLSGGTLTGALNGTSAVFSGDIRSNAIYRDYQGEALIQTSGSETQIGTSGAGTPRSVKIFAGNSPALTLASTGAATFTGALNGTSAVFSGVLTLNGANNVIRSGNELRFNRTDNAIYSRIFDAGSSFTFDNLNGNGFSFQSAGTPQFSIASTGAATFSSTVETTGIKFPAIQVASADANTLDDYEEGTWTIGITFGGASVGVTTSGNTGTYTKIGRQVTVNGIISLTSKGTSTGLVEITNLPFTIAAGASNFCAPTLWLNNVSFLNQFVGRAIPSTNVIRIEEFSNVGILSNITNADFANNSEVLLSLTYFV